MFLDKKTSYKWTKHRFFHSEAELKRQSIEWKHTDSSKENLLDTVFNKKGHADDSLLGGHERMHHD